jgi:hypothetical protein
MSTKRNLDNRSGKCNVVIICNSGNYAYKLVTKAKAVPQHAMKALGGEKV